MVKKAFLSITLLLAFLSVYAQQDTIATPVSVQAPAVRHVRISLLTVGPGAMLWEPFGHSCIRVIDSAQGGKKRDIIYNYGSFDNFEQDFVKKMIDGTLLYYLSVFPYDFFINAYVEKGRSVEEQIFVLDDAQRTGLVTNLEKNALPANKYYKYDFFDDNCSTRVYEMLANTLGKGFVPGPVIPKGIKVSFYDGSYEYYPNRHWERVGVGLIFQSRMSRMISDTTAFFLPMYLSRSFDGATVNGKKLCPEKIVMAADQMPRPPVLNGPFVLTAFIALLTIVGLSWKKALPLGKVMSYVVLFASGLLGCIMLYGWFGTDHKGCENNLNLLWALPFNLVIPFLNTNIKAKYAIAGIVLIGVTLVLHLLRIMELPLFETAPFLLALLWVYGAMYRKSALKMA